MWLHLTAVCSCHHRTAPNDGPASRITELLNFHTRRFLFSLSLYLSIQHSLICRVLLLLLLLLSNRASWLGVGWVLQANMRCRVWVNTTSGLSTTRQNPDPNRSTRRAFFWKTGPTGPIQCLPILLPPFPQPRHSTSVISLLNHIEWSPLSVRRKNSRLVAFYKAVNNLYPVLVGQLRPCSHQTRSYDPLTFTFLTPRTDYYKYLLLPRTIVDWN